jgi:hypothetical protein
MQPRSPSAAVAERIIFPGGQASFGTEMRASHAPAFARRDKVIAEITARSCRVQAPAKLRNGPFVPLERNISSTAGRSAVFPGVEVQRSPPWRARERGGSPRSDWRTRFGGSDRRHYKSPRRFGIRVVLRAERLSPPNRGRRNKWLTLWSPHRGLLRKSIYRVSTPPNN